MVAPPFPLASEATSTANTSTAKRVVISVRFSLGGLRHTSYLQIASSYNHFYLKRALPATWSSMSSGALSRSCVKASRHLLLCQRQSTLASVSGCRFGRLQASRPVLFMGTWTDRLRRWQSGPKTGKEVRDRMLRACGGACNNVRSVKERYCLS